jgi:hypothetical protein
MPADPAIDKLRIELRRLFLAASRGKWVATALADGECRVDALEPRGGRCLVAKPVIYADAKLTAAMHEALPVLFRALDEARSAWSVPVLGAISDGGRVAWTGSVPPPPPSALPLE